LNQVTSTNHPSYIPRSVLQGNTALLELQITDPSGQPVDITSSTLTFVLKASSQAADDDEANTVIETGSDQLTVLNEALGKVLVTIPNDDAHLAAHGCYWYHLNVTTAGLVQTAMCGPFYVAAV